jgi:hypothetical protein
MSVSLVLTCPVHGSDVEPFEVAGTKFCALCLRDYFKRFQAGHVHELKMTEVEVKQPERKLGETFVCNRCDCVWHVNKGRACPQCGLDALEKPLCPTRTS